ncbi:MAG: hypothetical protein SFY67_09430 [Candidatus Melainabacteria bacterium]|nr:hypothetical protein [Candidatus Melainabacteria bacterium]
MAAPSFVPEFSKTHPALSVQMKQDHLLLERVVAQRQLASYMRSKPDKNGNGHASGNGNGNGNGSQSYASGDDLQNLEQIQDFAADQAPAQTLDQVSANQEMYNNDAARTFPAPNPVTQYNGAQTAQPVQQTAGLNAIPMGTSVSIAVGGFSSSSAPSAMPVPGVGTGLATGAQAAMQTMATTSGTDSLQPKVQPQPNLDDLETTIERNVSPAPSVSLNPITPEEDTGEFVPYVAQPAPQLQTPTPQPQSNSFDFFEDAGTHFAPENFFQNTASPPEGDVLAFDPGNLARAVNASGNAMPTLVETSTPQAPTQDADESKGRPKVAMPRSIQGKVSRTVGGSAETGNESPQAAQNPSNSGSNMNAMANEQRSASRDLSEETTPTKTESVKDDNEKIIPRRRNFSGGGSQLDEMKPKAAAKSQKRKAKDDDNSENEDEGDSKPAKKQSAVNWLEENIQFVGIPMSRKSAGVMVIVALFILFQIPGWCSTIWKAASGGGVALSNDPGRPLSPLERMRKMPGGGSSMMGGSAPSTADYPDMPPSPNSQQQAGQQNSTPAPMNGDGTPVIGGKWKIIAFAGPKPFPGDMVLLQKGLQFSGTGRDPAGNFQIAGELVPPDKVTFAKEYDPESRKRGALPNTIFYEGRLQEQSGMYVCAGGYLTEKRMGFEHSQFNQSKMIRITGTWKAQQIEPATPQGGGLSIPFGQKPQDNKGLKKQDWQKQQDFFLKIGISCLVGGAVIVFLFYVVFSPEGLINQSEKNKYIPSQFKRQHDKMVKEFGKPLKAGGIPLGKRLEWHWLWFWTPRYLSLPPDTRTKNPHMLVLGGSDQGKTRMIASMVTHDIQSDDRAVVVIDSDGHLSDLTVNWIASQPNAAELAKRVIVIDPTFKAGSLAYNPLEYPDDGDLQAASSAIVHGFKAIYTEPPGSQSKWDAQTAHILRNAALLLMVNGRSLTDLPSLLQDNDFRDIMLETIERKKNEKAEYIAIMETWNQYKKLARTDQWITWVEPILNRVGPMLSDGRIRPILTKPHSDLKLKDVIKEKKILIVKVPQGELDQNANLLGSLIVTGIQQAAISLGRANSKSIRPVSLYLDEMDTFIEKETLSTITSESARYQIGFIGSIKTLQGLPEDYRNSLIISVGTIAVFALSKKDADMMGPQLFRVDGRKVKQMTLGQFFNPVNAPRTYELIMDEEKLNIDRVVGQEEQCYFCYRVGTTAGVFRLKAFDFKDEPENKIDKDLVTSMHGTLGSEV